MARALSAFPATLNFSGSEFTGLAGFNSNLAFPAGRPTFNIKSQDLLKTVASEMGIVVNFGGPNLGYTQDAAHTGAANAMPFGREIRYSQR
jgi:hypothetical protein